MNKIIFSKKNFNAANYLFEETLSQSDQIWKLKKKISYKLYQIW